MVGYRAREIETNLVGIKLAYRRNNMSEKIRTYGQCGICSKSFWLGDLTKVKSAALFSIKDKSYDDVLCKVCIKGLDSHKGVERPMVNDPPYLPLR